MSRFLQEIARIERARAKRGGTAAVQPSSPAPIQPIYAMGGRERPEHHQPPRADWSRGPRRYVVEINGLAPFEMLGRDEADVFRQLIKRGYRLGSRWVRVTEAGSRTVVLAF